eukprot:CAMPEP_0182591560 /NCGR_PEP_ID=MMETSP1324-20130603/74062_1 /TAXON_ID=236786 /ORGANISM="Florenciella sp., Strain RCC1587" /LENGTH=45 /DNA_ID= /DNA_START= /DNA_END= /DNA_ORIENTATION=
MIVLAHVTAADCACARVSGNGTAAHALVTGSHAASAHSNESGRSS